MVFRFLRRTSATPVQWRRSRNRGMARLTRLSEAPASSTKSLSGRPTICGNDEPTRSAKLRLTARISPGSLRATRTSSKEWNKAPQFGNFRGALPDVQTEQDYQNDQANGIEAQRERPNGVPRNCGEDHG